MLTNLINVLLISIGTGACLNAPVLPTTKEQPTKITIQEKTKRANDPTTVLTYDMNITKQQWLSGNHTIHVDGDEINEYVQSWKLNAYNQAINLHGNLIKQRSNINGVIPGYPFLCFGTQDDPTNIELNGLQTQLFALQITPYNINLNTKFYLNINCTAQVDYYEGTPQVNYNVAEIGFVITRVQSIENGFQTIIDNQYFMTNDINYLYNDLLSASNGFNYTYDTYKVKLNDTNVQNFNLDNYMVEIDIQPQRNNYVLLYIQPYFVKNNAPTTTNDSIYTENVINFDWGLETYNTYKITGTNVVQTNTTEIVDIPGIMFDVLTMPFSFISIAFNLTLFPGTPYQLNISNLFLIIIAVAVFAFLLNILLKASTGGK